MQAFLTILIIINFCLGVLALIRVLTAKEMPDNTGDNLGFCFFCILYGTAFFIAFYGSDIVKGLKHYLTFNWIRRI